MSNGTTRLRRGFWSRVLGDAIFGDLFPSQAVFGVAVVMTTETKLAWLLAVPLATPAVVAVTWSANVHQSTLVGRVLGFTVMRIRLGDATRTTFEVRKVARGSVKVLVLEGVIVERAVLQGESMDRIALGYTRCIGEQRMTLWVQAIQRASATATA